MRVVIIIGVTGAVQGKEVTEDIIDMVMNLVGVEQAPEKDIKKVPSTTIRRVIFCTRRVTSLAIVTRFWGPWGKVHLVRW
uniref:Putative secreted protein n=1 Tax=Xenopsylla cheopis TaxID=163159 RepID=A0A6M2DYD8_XENCH